MAAFFLISLFLFVLFDARLLREQNEAGYQQIYGAPPEKWAFYTSFLFVVMLPVYLLRRKEFKDLPGPDVDPLFSGRRLASDAAGVILLWICLELFGIVILYGLSSVLPLFQSELSRMVLITIFSSVLLVGLIYKTTAQYPHGFWGSVGLRHEPEVSFIKRFGIPFALGVGFAFFSATLLMSREVQPDTPLSDLIASSGSAIAIFAFLAVALLLAPLLEEIIFRGYFFGVLCRYKGRAVAIAAVGASFAFLHYEQYWGDWLAIALVTLLGFALTLVRSWSGSTIPSIVMHYTYNFFVTLIPVITLLISNPSYVQYVALYDKLTPEQKETLLEDSIRRNPGFTEAYNDLAWLYAQEQKDLEEALDLIEMALKKEPGNPVYLDTKAEVLYQMGRVEDAITIEEALVRDHPKDPGYRSQLEKFRAQSQPRR